MVETIASWPLKASTSSASGYVSETVCTLLWEGKVDLEDLRERMETVNWDSLFRASRIEGPTLPPACGVVRTEKQSQKGWIIPYTNDHHVLYRCRHLEVV